MIPTRSHKKQQIKRAAPFPIFKWFFSDDSFLLCRVCGAARTLYYIHSSIISTVLSTVVLLQDKYRSTDSVHTTSSSKKPMLYASECPGWQLQIMLRYTGDAWNCTISGEIAQVKSTKTILNLSSPDGEALAVYNQVVGMYISVQGALA